jgi:hypothetical protein
MVKSSVILAAVAIAALAACQTEQQTLNSGESAATQAALQRGQFDLNCPAATAQVLSREEIQPVVFGGKVRTEYTVGVAGCGQRSSYIVACEAGTNNCFAAQPRGTAPVTR